MTGQVAWEVGHKCWQANVLLMLSTLAISHTDTHRLRVQAEHAYDELLRVHTQARYHTTVTKVISYRSIYEAQHMYLSFRLT